MPDDGVKRNKVQTWMTYGSAKNNELNNKDNNEHLSSHRFMSST